MSFIQKGHFNESFAALQVCLWFQEDIVDSLRVEPLGSFQLVKLCVQQTGRTIKIFPLNEKKWNIWAACFFFNDLLWPRPRLMLPVKFFLFFFFLNYQMCAWICTNLSLSDTAITLSQSSPAVFTPQCLSFHGYSECALGHTPEPCYATAPNNSHLLLLLLCQFNTSQTGRSLRLHMD